MNAMAARNESIGLRFGFIAACDGLKTQCNGSVAR